MIVENEFASDFACPAARERDGSCVGSLCMAWRWHRVKNEADVPHNPMLAHPPAHPADFIEAWKNSDTHGYCGLAGAP